MMSGIVEDQKRTNRVQTFILVAAMAGLLAVAGFLLAGAAGMWAALVIATLLAVFGPRLSPAWILRLYGARPLDRRQAPELVALIEELAQRGDVAPPRLFYIASRSLNAFAVGENRQAAIAVTDGLLRNLNQRELTAVLAHELSHVRHRDMHVMGLADVFARLTSAMARVGVFATLLSLPALLMHGASWWFAALILLAAAPLLSGLLQLALSRSREFAADVGAVELTGDPLALASALRKIERSEPHSMLRQVLYPQGDHQETSLLRTHPATEERVARLVQMSGDSATMAPRPPRAEPRRATLLHDTPRVLRPPGFHAASGLWF
jgi:heat shock protein HtpX